MSRLKFAFVICGKQREEDRQAFARLATESGVPFKVHFTGAIPTPEINWWFHHADASLAGTGYQNWEKSTGILAAVERGLPVWLIRGTEDSTDGVERLDLLLDHPIRAMNCPKTTFKSRHHPDTVAKTFETLAAGMIGKRS